MRSRSREICSNWFFLVKAGCMLWLYPTPKGNFTGKNYFSKDPSYCNVYRIIITRGWKIWWNWESNQSQLRWENEVGRVIIGPGSINNERKPRLKENSGQKLFCSCSCWWHYFYQIDLRHYSTISFYHALPKFCLSFFLSDIFDIVISTLYSHIQ